MNSGIALGRVFGTEIRVHWSWIPVLAILTVFFAVGLDGEAGPQWPAGLAWATAIATSVLVFGSVVLHELAHVAVARRGGIGGNVVVVQLLGGTYVMDLRALSPGQQFRVAAAGPLVSTGLVGLFGIVALVDTATFSAAGTGPSGLEAIGFAAITVGLFNAFLVVVNLIPGYPMDGGQLVHAIAWRRSGDQRKANGTVSRIGRFAGFVLLALGAGLAVALDWLPGLGLMVAGWVLVSSSRMLERRGFIQSLTNGLHAVDAADSESTRVPPQLTLDVFAAEYMGARLGSAALVESGGKLLGLISQAQIRRIPKRNWPTTRTDHAMVPIANVPHADPEADLWPTLEVLERSGQDALVIGSGEPEVVLMTRRSAARLIHERAQEHVRRKNLADNLVGFGRRRQPAAPVEPPARIPPDASRPPSDEGNGGTGADQAPDQDDADGERR